LGVVVCVSLFSTTAVQHAAVPAMLCRNNDEDTEIMLNNLRTHKYQALILDSPVVQYFAAKVGVSSCLAMQID
jgi:hypothetical protein